MIEILKNIFKFQIPLPNSPLKELSCYVICGKDRNLIIDTGYNTEEGKIALKSVVSTLNLDLDKTDIFLTHLHSDHTGLISTLKTEKNKAFISAIDGDRLKKFLNDDYWKNFMDYQDYMGVSPAEKLKYTDHPAYQNKLDLIPSFTYIDEGETLSYGNYVFEVIDIKGHTPGHLGLFDRKNSVLFCGDHILDKISPNINLWDFKEDYLGLYLENLKKVVNLNPKHTLTAHRKLPISGKDRASELLIHHENRLCEILEILKTGAETPVLIAEKMKWDFAGGDFSKFPRPQKWFATSEAFAHLEHLYAKGLVKRNNSNNLYRYFI